MSQQQAHTMKTNVLLNNVPKRRFDHTSVYQGSQNNELRTVS